MTALRPPIDELELPVAIVRRLAGVDAELRPTPRWRPVAAGRSQLHVVRGSVGGRRRLATGLPNRRRSLAEPLVAAAVAIAFFGLGYLASRPSDQAGRFVSPSVAAFVPLVTPTPSPSPTPAAPTPATKPTPSGNGPEIINGSADGATLIAHRLDWTCRLHGDASPERVDLVMVDKIAVSRGIDEGLVATSEKVLVWLGMDPDVAGRAFKAFLIAHGGDGSTWIALRTENGVVAHELAARRTPMGQLVWLLGDTEQQADCAGQKLPIDGSTVARFGDPFVTRVTGLRLIGPTSTREPGNRAS